VGDNLIAAICPRCGAGLKFPEGMESAYCMYCGTQVLIGRAAETSHMVECTVCDGMGRVEPCKACDGTGDCTWSSKGDSAHQSIFMIGFIAVCRDGICSACNGSGSYMLGSCPGCGGTGRCPSCHGSGKCPACRGLGFMPDPHGSVTCSACGGRGVRSIDANSKSKSAEMLRRSPTNVCPSCNQRVDPGQSRCSNCGYSFL
jgi:hypothetical protein